jgi:cell division protein FtsZ
MMGTGSATGENRAHEAATAAVQSPLLDDVNLVGAKGILVNITAGLDLAIGEFDEVGNTVRDFADEDATVVVGTVIDPEMQGELRVTVVATGLGETADQPVLSVVEPKEDIIAVKQAVGEETVTPNYADYDTPPSIRKSNAARDAKRYVDAAVDRDMEFLDIPAFLRRQAD